MSAMGLGEDVRQQLVELTHTIPPAQLVLPLRDFARDVLARGYSYEELLEVFEDVRADLREENDEAREDAVMDVMDFLSGWSSSHMKLDSRRTGGTWRRYWP
jgi:hypothetical protein